MKTKILSMVVVSACVSVARADFNPVALTPNSYTYDIVVEKSAPGPMPYCITASVGGGTGEGDHTFFERGVWDRTGGGAFCGVPQHGTTFTNQSNPNIVYVMPSDYTVNNGLLIDSGVTSGTITLNTPTTATNISILAVGGSGGVSANYTVNHMDGITTETGSYNPGDWFGGSNPAWYCAGRIGTPGGGYDSINTSGSSTAGATGSNPRMYSRNIAVSSASPVTSISFSYGSGGGHNCYFAVSYNGGGSNWVPAAISGFNEILLFPFTYPLTATMDDGTNISNTGSGNNTWYEQGYDTNAPGTGVPPSGSVFNSFSQPTHHYQMGNYSNNNAILISTNLQVATIVPAAPAIYTSFAFLTAGANIGGTPMQIYCIMQHADGVIETNLFFGFDWFDSSHNGAIAWKANGRLQMYDRTLNNVNNNFPYLFESYFVLTDLTSPVTNIVAQFKSGGASATTYILAISASTNPVPPVITSGPLPTEQAWYTNQSATFTAVVAGSQPMTNTWLVNQAGNYVPLADGLDANGSTISGSSTTALTISGITVADGTSYELMIANAAGSVTSAPVVLNIKGRAGVVPAFFWNNIANETYPLGTTTNILASDGVTTATFQLDDTGAPNGFSSGIAGDGSVDSLMNGFMDAHANNTGDALTTITGLADPAYDVYLYTLADNSRPGSATDGLPNYAVNGTNYYAPILGAVGNSTYDLTSAAVGGNGFNGFVPATTYPTNDFNKDIPVSSFGNYIKLAGVSAAGGEITVESEFDTTSFRSPLNGIQLVSTSTGKSFGIHFIGNTADAVAPTPARAPIIVSQAPAISPVLILTNHVHTILLSVTVSASSAPPFSYQWFNGATAVSGATNSSYAPVGTNGATYTCVITNFVGSITSSPVAIQMYVRPPLTPYQAGIFAYNPVGYWPLTETSGNIAADYASTNDGIYTGGYTLGQPGLPPTVGIGANVSAGFDGSTAYVDIPVDNLNITSALTAIIWIQTPVGGETDFGTALGHSDQSYRLSVVNGANDPRFADAGPDIVGTTSVGDNNWHQLVGVYDGTNQYLYLDGQPTGTPAAGTPSGSGRDVLIAAAPDYLGARNFKGNIAQVAIIAQALTAAQVQSVYYNLDTAPSVTITPASPSIFAGSSATLTAQFTGTPPTNLQWYQIDTLNNSNNIANATNATYTISDAQISQNGYQYGIIASNPYGTATAVVTLSVQNGPAYLVGDISPLTGEAYAGAPVTYSVNAQGSLPINYQWFVDSAAVAGATNASFTLPAPCGTNAIYVQFTNSGSAGTPVVSSTAWLQGDSSPTNITFNTDGTGWEIRGSPSTIANNLLTLTDGGSGEDSSAFYTVPQYVGSFSAFFTYTGDGSADGAAFIIQNSSAGASALGGGGGGLGYQGISNSVALEINLYSGNGEIPGIAAGTNGNTFGNGGAEYTPPYPIGITSGDPINVQLNFANGVLAVSMLDTVTLDAFHTNYVFGALPAILNGSSLGYVGFSGADGGATSIQTITNFVFSSVITPVAMSAVSLSANSFMITWPAADPNYVLQTSTSLSSPSWVAGPTPTIVGGVNQVTVNVNGGTRQQYYRLVHVGCP